MSIHPRRFGSFLLVAVTFTALAAASFTAHAATAADAPSFVNASASAPAPPPAAKADPVTDTYHGQQVVDEYRWLEALEKDSPDVAAWTSLQNDYTRARLDSLACRSKMEEALRPLMQIGSISAPRMGGNLYIYTERAGTQNQPVVKIRTFADGEPRVLLDVNALDSKGLTALDWWQPSHDNSMLAFGISKSGSEMSELHLLDTATGRWLADEISGKVTFSSWTPDGRAFLYSVLRDPEDPYSRESRYHEIGTSPRFDPVLLKQSNPSEIPFAALSHDGRWLFTGLSRGWQANDLSVQRFEDWKRTGELTPMAIAKGLDARTQPEATIGDTLYASTTFDSPNGRIVAIDLNSAGDPKQWKTFLPERKDAVLQNLQLARELFVATYEKDATSLISRLTLGGQPLPDLALPAIGTASLSTDEDRTEAFLTFTSFTVPRTIYRLDLATTGMSATKRADGTKFDSFSADNKGAAAPAIGAAVGIPTGGPPPTDITYRTLPVGTPIGLATNTKAPSALTQWARTEVPIDPSKYEVKQVRAKSRDGTEVPMFMVSKKGATANGENPCLLTAYGGFNVSLTPAFNPTIVPWLDAGGLWVQANLRGGGEYGEGWHRAGMLSKKQNVFDDFYACAEWLISNKWTNANRLAIEGGSNGGLLTGTAITQRPELFTAAIVSVPLLDMLRYDKFLLAKYWVPEYGSAENAEAYGWLRAYSPYHHITQGTKYPAVFLNAGENDSRVHPLHARKMAAKLQALAANDPVKEPIFLWIDRDAGHGQGKPLSLRIRDEADQWSFLMWQTGLCN